MTVHEVELTRTQETILRGLGGMLASCIAVHPVGTRYRLRLHPMDWPAFFPHPTEACGLQVKWDETIMRGSFALAWKRPK